MKKEYTSVQEIRNRLSRAMQGEDIQSVLSDISDDEWADKHASSLWQAVFYPVSAEWGREISTRHHVSFAKNKAQVLSDLKKDNLCSFEILFQVGCLILEKIVSSIDTQVENTYFKGLPYKKVAEIYARYLPDLDLNKPSKQLYSIRFDVVKGERRVVDEDDTLWMYAPLHAVRLFEKFKEEKEREKMLNDVELDEVTEEALDKIRTATINEFQKLNDDQKGKLIQMMKYDIKILGDSHRQDVYEKENINS